MKYQPDSPVAGAEIAPAGMHISVLTSGGEWHERLETPSRPANVVLRLAALIRAHAGQPTSESRVGLAVWGTVDPRSGVVYTLRNASTWDHFPLATELELSTARSVYLISAPSAAALAEARYGAGAGYDTVLYLSLDQTVSTSLVSHGAIVNGKPGSEYAIAHYPSELSNRRCSCGQYGHIEPVASAQSLVRNFIGKAADSDASTGAMLQLSHGRAEALSPHLVFRLAADGDEAAQAVVGDALTSLASGLATVLGREGASVVIIGGPVAAAGALLTVPLLQLLVTRLSAGIPAPDIQPAMLGKRGVLIGAALAADIRQVHG